MQGKPESSDPRDVLGAFDISLCKGQSGATSSQLFLYTFFPFRCCSLYEPHDCFRKIVPDHNRWNRERPAQKRASL
jgi:hypothetical protein